MVEVILDVLRDGTVLVLTFGYAGIFVAMLVEGSGIPLPFPGTLLLAFVGYTVWTGNLGLVESSVAAAAGSTLGAWLLYRVARDAGSQLVARHGYRLALTSQKIGRAESWFKVHAGRAMFFARLIPGVRVYISVAAGLAHMNQGLFLGATFAGAWLWMLTFVVFGWALGESWRSLLSIAGAAPIPLLLAGGTVVLVLLLINRRRVEDKLK